ncbi:ArnT family glycosyltransferase [Chachezhania sediminis]|uniref:ArnT family glycosyltransferase n=1 Tax=Chachezhania sediminis TaxID=2599291 RepID=UPI00131D515A|nr:glycosyltransferase family 39 protein [Chachezhania sediminis]
MDRALRRIELGMDRLGNARPPVPMLLVAVLALILFLPGFFEMPPVDRDEARFAQASRQMVESGDFVDIRLGEETRYKKPVGIYWFQAAAVKLCGPDCQDEIWAYRLPSLAGAVAAVLLTYLIALTLMGSGSALVAAILMASCFVLGAEARLAKTDAVLLAAILSAQAVLARLWMRPGDRLPAVLAYAFWVALAVGTLVKGPIPALVLGTTVLGLAMKERGFAWLRELRPLPGFILFLALVIPWFVLISVKAGHAFWDEALGRDLLGKIGEGQENHGAPPGTYSLGIWLTFWPASIFLPLGLVAAWKGWRLRSVWFCLVWILPSWIVFEIVATKLIHYVLPVIPGLAVLSASGWLARPEGRPKIGLQIYVGIMLGLAVLLLVVPAYVTFEGGQWPGIWWYAGVVVMALSGFATWRAVRQGWRYTPVLCAAGLGLALSMAFYAQVSRVAFMWPSVPMATLQNEAELCNGDPVLLTVGYAEPSLLFLTHDWAKSVGPEEAAAAVEQADCAFVLVEKRDEARFQAGLTRAGVATGTVRGMNIGNGREVEITGYLFR